ncbi:MAG: hypothetical protein ACRDSL_17860 [Pseudonocardiaceae bacterium]
MIHRASTPTLTTQDGTEIAAIGARHVRIFKFGADGRQPHVRPLGINFFDPNQVEAVQGLIADKLRSDDSAGYVNDFAATQFVDVPNDYSQITRAQRGRLILYASLLRASFTLPQYNAGTTRSYSVLIRMLTHTYTVVAHLVRWVLSCSASLLGVKARIASRLLWMYSEKQLAALTYR